MFEIHFGLRENPFVSGHQPRFVFPSPEHQEALAHLRFGIENREPFVLITGEVGTGKTTALYDVLIEWKGRVHVALINNSALTRSELLEEICLRLGFTLPEGSSKPQVLIHLERHLLAVHARGERAILLLDEAQNLDRELLEEIRLLSNLEIEGEKLLQVFLVGQPELEERLARAELRQLRQRISVHYRLKPLSLEDTERYIHHRISVAGGYAPDIFPAASCRAVYELSHGIPREINHICKQSMLGAYVDDAHVVLPEHVQAAASEIEFKSVMREGGDPTATTAPTVPPPRSTPREPVEPPAPLAPRTMSPPPPRSATTPPIERVPLPPPAEPSAPYGTRPWAPPAAPVEPRREIEPPRHVEPPRYVEASPRAAEPPRPIEPSSRPARPLSVVEPEHYRVARTVERPSPSTVEELEDGDASTTTIKWLLGLVAVAGIVIATVLLVRFAPWGAKQGEATPKPSPAAPAESTAAAPAATSAPAPTTAPAETTTKIPSASASPTSPPEPVASAPVTAPPLAHRPIVEPAPRAAAPKRPVTHVVPPAATHVAPADTVHAPSTAPPRMFGVAVASFLDQGRAEAERGRLAAATKMSAQVRTVVADSVSRFELVLGSFASQDAAERAASDLISRGLVDEARVVAQAKSPAPASAPH